MGFQWMSDRGGWGNQEPASGSDSASPPDAVKVLKPSQTDVGEEGKEIAQHVTQQELPRATVVRYPKPVPKLQQKLEIGSEDGKGSSSNNMWQVYAMAGFMVGRWIWARVKERRARRFNREDDD